MSDDEDIHIEHCSKCHFLKCPFDNDFGCQIVRCPQCQLSLHSCKIEDHVENICPKTFLPCINKSSGCNDILRRDKRAAHLSVCPASVVVCGREWGRRILSPQAKLQLKSYGKGRTVREKIPINDKEIDILAAESDQNMLISSYCYPRSYRVNQRDGLNKSHPVIPLREISGYSEENTNKAGTSNDNEENSSDEEKREKESKLKKKKAMFANCYMCQIDPASQHLHTLGNESGKFKLGRPIKKWPAKMDDLHSRNHLTISTFPECIPEFMVKGENIRFIGAGGTLYTRRCLRTVHRNEFGDHHVSQHVNSLDSLSDLIVRCPNWSRGCAFHTYRMKPKEGRIRFLNALDCFLHCPQPNTATYSGKGLDELPVWAIIEICKYLPSSAIFLLTLTSKRLRQMLFSYCERSIVEVEWKKEDGKWVQKNSKISFTVSDHPTEMTWSLPPGLSDHILCCEYSEPTVYEQEKVPIFPVEFHEEIVNFFAERLPVVMEWWSTFQHGHSDSIVFGGNNAFY